MFGIRISSVQRIMLDLSITKVCARWVSLLLHEDQMQSRTFASKEFLKNQQKHALFLRRNEYDVKQVPRTTFGRRRRCADSFYVSLV